MADLGSCANCVHWDRGGAAIATAISNPAADPDVGTCCAMPPQLIREGPYWATAAWPQTHASRFCSEWEPIDDPDGGEREPSNVVAFERSVA